MPGNCAAGRPGCHRHFNPKGLDCSIYEASLGERSAPGQQEHKFTRILPGLGKSSRVVGRE